MKLLLLPILSFILLVSCSQNPNNTRGVNSEPSNLKIDESDNKLKSLVTDVEQAKDNAQELLAVFSKATEIFPADSASLYRFYYKTFLASTFEERQKQIERIEALLERKTVEQYKEVSSELKPLFRDIVKAKSLNKEQSERLVYLYSIYDQYSGSSLFSQVLSDEDNYSLVWKSFEILVAQSEMDTCNISSLISLDNAIRTNAELGEAMGGFVTKAIKNNPIGFLKMYSVRSDNDRENLSKHAMLWDDPMEELISIFEGISINSTDSMNRILSKELLGKIGVKLTKTTQKSNSSVFVGFIDQFYNHSDFYTSLFFKGEYSELAENDLVKNRLDVVFKDDETTRIKIDEESIIAHMDVDNLDSLLVVDENQEITDTISRKNYEYYDANIQTEYISTYEYKKDKGYDIAVISSFGVTEGMLRKSPPFKKDSAYLNKLIDRNHLRLDYLHGYGFLEYKSDTIAFFSFSDYVLGQDFTYLFRNGVPVDSIHNDFVIRGMKPIPLASDNHLVYVSSQGISETDILWNSLLAIDLEHNKFKFYKGNRLKVIDGVISYNKNIAER